jgi:methylthioribose-1-phosphate isomerase
MSHSITFSEDSYGKIKSLRIDGQPYISVQDAYKMLHEAVKRERESHNRVQDHRDITS